MVQTSNLSFYYESNNPLQFPDIHCEEGQHWLLLGQSGSGKTTLLHLLGGLLTPKNGSVLINNTEVQKLSGAQLDQFRGKNIGIIFQKNHFISSLNVTENLLLAQQLAGNTPNKKRAHELLDRLNIGHKKNASTGSLSQGEKQRVAIARALMNQPSLILADEPTAALDDKNTKEVVALLMESANAVGATLLVVTHDTRLKNQFSKTIELPS